MSEMPNSQHCTAITHLFIAYTLCCCSVLSQFPLYNMDAASANIGTGDVEDSPFNRK